MVGGPVLLTPNPGASATPFLAWGVVACEKPAYLEIAALTQTTRAEKPRKPSKGPSMQPRGSYPTPQLIAAYDLVLKSGWNLQLATHSPVWWSRLGGRLKLKGPLIVMTASSPPPPQ
jgi:hypothetical protein